MDNMSLRLHLVAQSQLVRILLRLAEDYATTLTSAVDLDDAVDGGRPVEVTALNGKMLEWKKMYQFSFSSVFFCVIKRTPNE